ncbi:MAG: arylamine N-acetyltransferase [Chloroflexi bacterium]|nr:arylamine N-acetyltransferase [Chloroflexota bacterium]
MTKLQAYLDRIHITHMEPPSLAYLAKLQAHHLLAVPFENFSVMQNEPVVLNDQWLVDKVVVRRRGGFCYELNGAFGWLLRELGFAVSRISARAYHAESDHFSPEFDHMALLVQLDKPYLVDVGFGELARQPMALPDGTTEDVGGRYRILPINPSHDEYHLQKWQPDGWCTQYSFTTEAHEFPAYGPMCEYHQNGPNSSFKTQAFCTIATTTGRLTLSPDSLTITTGEHKEKVPITSPAQYSTWLDEHFGMRV